MAEGDPGELLPEIDREFLEQKEVAYDVVAMGGELHVILRDYPFPDTYQPHVADLLIILPAGYPNAHPDMFWTYPDVKLKSGNWPQRSQAHKVYGVRNWQRWSRHYSGNWRTGIDGLRSYLAVVKTEIAKGI